MLPELLNDNLDAGSLVLDSAQLGGGAVSELVDAYCEARRLVIQNATIEESDGSWRVIGLGSLLGVFNTHVEALFREDAEGVSLRITADQLPLGWAMSTSFPGMAGSFVDTLTFRHPTLILDSHDPDPLPRDFQVELGHPPDTAGMEAHVSRGLHFEAEVDLGAWNFAAWLLNGERITVRGPIELQGGAARMWLKADLQGPASVGSFEFPLEFQLISFFAEPGTAESPPVPESYARLCADLALDDGDTELRLPLAARIDTPEIDFLTLEALPEELSVEALSQLQGLLGQAVPEGLLPDGFPAFDRLRLSLVQLKLIPAAGRLWSILVDLDLDGSWRLAGAFELGGLRLRLIAVPSFGSVTAGLFATTEIGGVELDCYLGLPELDYRLTMFRGGIGLAAILDHFGVELGAPADLECRSLAISGDVTSGAFTLLSGVEADLSVSLATVEVGLEEMEIYVDHGASSTTGVLSGTVGIGELRLRADWRLPGDLVLTGEVSRLGLSSWLAALLDASPLGDLPVPGGFFDVDLEEVSFVLDTGAEVFTIQAAVAAWGEAEVSVQRAATGWGYGLGLRLREGFVLSDVAVELALLDGIELGNAYLLLSSFAFAELSLPNQPQQSVQRVEKGINFFLPMRLGEFPGVSFLDGVVDLEVDISLRGAFSTGRELLLEAALGGFEIVNGVEFSTVGFRVRAKLADIALSLFGTLVVSLKDELTFTGEVTAEPTGAYLSATMEGTWNEPFGIKGFTLSDVALQVGWAASGLPAAGVAGSVVVGGFEGSFAVLLNSVDPVESVLQLAFDELSTEVLFDELMSASVRRAVPVELRELLAYGYRDVEVHLVPETTRIGRITFEQGFRLRGKTALLGIEGEIDARLDYGTGLEAEGRIDRIRLARIPGGPYAFSLTDARNKEKGPRFDVDLTTTSVPSLLLTGRVDMLGFFAQEVLAEGGLDGFTFRLERKVGPTEAKLGCTLGDEGLAASGDLSFDLDFSVNVKVPGTDMKLGRVTVKSALVGHTELAVGPEEFLAGVTGSFEWRKQSLSIPEVQIRKTPRDMDDLLRLIVDGIKDNADDLFSDLLGSLEDLMQAMGEGVIAVGKAVGQTAEDVGGAIADAYGASAEAAAEFFAETDFSPSEVGGALKKGFASSAEEAAKVLKGAGYASEEVGKALKGGFSKSANTVAKALKGAGFGSKSTAKALKGTFTNSTTSAAKALKAAGFNTSRIGSALKGTFSDSHDTVGKALKAAGCSAKDSAKVLKDTFNKGSKNVAKHFKKEWNKGDNGVKNLLKDSGFSKNNVKSAMEDVFNWGPAKFVTGWF